MAKVEISFRLDYIKSNLSSAEHNPCVACYLDSNFKRKWELVPLKRAGTSHKITVSGVGDPVGGSALCFASMSSRNNEFGNACLMDAGTDHITFDEIAEVIKKKGIFVKEIDMLMHTVENFNKGTYRITITKDGFKTPGFRAHVGDTIVSVNPTAIKDMLYGYAEKVMQIEQSMEEHFEGTDRMRMPFDYSQSGFQSTNGVPLPAIAYVMAETPGSNAHYWENAFEMVMRRDGLKPQEWHRLNTAGKARATILTICYIAQYGDYISDTIDTNIGQSYNPQNVHPDEDFGDYLAMIAGDCEDLSGAELQCYNSLQQQKFPEGSVMREVQEISTHYVPPLNLDVVRGAQASDDGVQHMGAHMNDNFIPIGMFRKWLENTREGRQVSATLPWPKLDTKISKINPDELPFLVGEGTGMYEPLGFQYSLMPIMAYVYRAPSLEMFKKPILHKKGETGPFFVGSLVGMTDYFYRRGANAPTGFWYRTKDPKTGAFKRGVSYEDMMSEQHQENISIMLHPEPERHVMQVVNEAVSRRIPPRDLVLTPGAGEAHKWKSHPLLDRLVSDVASFKRAKGPATQYVPVYVRPHQLTRESVAQIGADMRKLERVWKIDYNLEEITDEIFGYRMSIYVN
jgi:hypothetical protein